jgi:DNA-binding winged helix-turn-helix (wHTH) protein
MPQDNPATGPATGDQTILCIGEFRLDLHLRSLNREGEKVKITPRPLATLEYLVRNRHRVVSKAELLDKVWGGQREISAVEHVIGQLRRALGENADEVRYIETVPGQGYRLIAEVRAAGVIDAAPAIPDNEVAGASATPPVRSPVSRRPRLALIALGFVAVLGVSFGVRALAPHLGRPVVRRTLINGKTLTAIGDTGGVLWTRELDLPWKERNPGEDEPTWRNQIVDLGRDGSPDVLVAAPTAPGRGSTPLFLSSRQRTLALPGADSGKVRRLGRRWPLDLSTDAGPFRQRIEIDLSKRHPSDLVAVLCCTDFPFR